MLPIVWPLCPRFTVAESVSVALAPFRSVPTVQVTLSQVPCDGAAETNVSPEGTASATETSSAVLGPLFVTVTV